MKIRFQAVALGSLALAVAASGCAQVQAKAAFKDGNKAYKEERFREAIQKYERSLELEPDMPEALFYLGSSHQALYRPGKESPENQQHLEEALAKYQRSLEVNQGQTENEKQVRSNALAALTGIYSEDPKKNYEEAIKYATLLVQENPNDIRNQFAMANLYEKFDRVDPAQQVYEKVFAENPADVKACDLVTMLLMALVIAVVSSSGLSLLKNSPPPTSAARCSSWLATPPVVKPTK